MPKPKNKKYKSLDDDSCNIVKIAAENDTEITESDDNDILIEKTEEDDSIHVDKTDDGTLTVYEVSPNLPPKRMWSDGVKLKFKTGDLVIKKGDKNLGNIIKILGPGIKQDTYSVISSGADGIWYISTTSVKKAPPEAKWESYLSVLKKKDPYEQYKMRMEVEKQKNKKKKK